VGKTTGTLGGTGLTGKFCGGAGEPMGALEHNVALQRSTAARKAGTKALLKEWKLGAGTTGGNGRSHNGGKVSARTCETKTVVVKCAMGALNSCG